MASVLTYSASFLVATIIVLPIGCNNQSSKDNSGDTPPSPCSNEVTCEGEDCPTPCKGSSDSTIPPKQSCGEGDSCKPIVSLNGSCTGVFIGKRTIVSSAICVGENIDSIDGVDGQSYQLSHLISANPEIIGHSLRQGHDLILVETKEDFQGTPLKLHPSRQSLNSIFAEAEGRYKPELESVKFNSYLRESKIDEEWDWTYINYRYDLYADGRESAFGSNFVSPCEHGFLQDSKREYVLGISSRWLIADSKCQDSDEGAKIFTPIHQELISNIEQLSES